MKSIKGSWELFSCQAPWNAFQVQTWLHESNKSCPNLKRQGNETHGHMHVVYYFMAPQCSKNTCSVVQRFIFNRIPEEQFKWQKSEIISLKTAQAQLTADRARKLQVNGVRKGADLASLWAALFVCLSAAKRENERTECLRSLLT